MGIYAGRTEQPILNKHLMTYEELAARAQEQGKNQAAKPKVQEIVKDKVTFSEEGMKSAKEMREYLNENNLNFNRLNMVDSWRHPKRQWRRSGRLLAV